MIKGTSEALNTPAGQELALTAEAMITEGKPAEVVVRAVEAARELKKIVNARPNRLVVNGEQYLYFEDWQTVGRFYGVTVRTAQVTEIRDEGKLTGFTAYAQALHRSQVISAAEADCCFDEPNWKSKPRFQLKSMAQTRACAKALRNVLAWVVVLAGYQPTPAEEMARAPAPAAKTTVVTDKASPGQVQRIWIVAKEHGYTPEKVHEYILNAWHAHSTKQLTREQASDLVAMIEGSGTLPVDPAQVKKDIEDLWPK